MANTKIIAFAGSTRTESLNKKLVQYAAEQCRQAGAEVVEIDLRDYPLPIYDGDLEQQQGAPENATKLYELMVSCDGFLIASPEYNSSISAVLKNVIDWVSRPRDGEPPLAAFSGKVAGLLSASPGGLGGLRGLVHLRAILQNIGMLVVPKQMAVGGAMTAFDEDGSLKDDRTAAGVKTVATQLAETARKLKG